MSDKPHSPYPYLLRVILRKIFPDSLYRQYIGRHEDGSLHLWQHLALKVTYGKAILDIGAYRGVYALAARKVNQEALIFAFEPNPFSVQELKNACLGKRIEVIATAVGERNGTVTFLCSGAGSRIIKPNNTQSENISIIQTISLDNWCEKRSVIPSIIKIDAEGAEASILLGAKLVLTNYLPIILCEVLSDSAGSEVMAVLPSMYMFYSIDENSKSISKKAKISRLNWRNKNWLLVPKGQETTLDQSTLR
ncbi:MAG: FkbM family methyltransferase [Chloroflexota bacterium]